MCYQILDIKIPKSMEKPPKLGESNGKEDSDEHMQFFNDQLNYSSVEESSKWKLFALTLVGPTRLWFNSLSSESIESWIYFCEQFSMHFTAQKRKLVFVAALSEIVKGKKESMWPHINWFTLVSIEVEGAIEGLKCWILENDLLQGYPFMLKIGKKRVWTTQEMLNMGQSFFLMLLHKKKIFIIFIIFLMTRADSINPEAPI